MKQAANKVCRAIFVGRFMMFYSPLKIEATCYSGNSQLTFNILHHVIFQKIEMLIIVIYS
jgi:hypothetical protein